MRIPPILWVTMFSLAASSSWAADISVSYSGETSWDAASGTFTFLSSGSFPDTEEGFYWDVPREVRKIQIGDNIRVTGGFRVGYRPEDEPLEIRGADRKTSVIFGTKEQAWSQTRNLPESEKWKYGAINVLADAVVTVANLTSLNPRAYHISGYANQSVIHLKSCDLIDDRGGDQNNSDGFAGSAGSTITDCFISTCDDAIKLYHDIEIRETTIHQHRNGAALQLGWGGETGDVKVVIRNLTIEGVDPEKLYNMAPITWERGNGGSRYLDTQGLKVKFPGKIYQEDSGSWTSAVLLELKPRVGKVILRLRDSEIEIPLKAHINTPLQIKTN